MRSARELFIVAMLCIPSYLAGCDPQDPEATGQIARGDTSLETGAVEATEDLAGKGDVAWSITVPSGFSSISAASGTGVTLYTKSVSGGSPDYVTVVDLRTALVKSFAGATSGSAPDYSVARASYSSWWTTAESYETSSETLRVLINGTFFSTSEDPAPLAFGLKISDSVLSTGYSKNTEYPGLEQVLRFNNSEDECSITDWSSTVYSGSYPNMVGALDPEADKSSSSWLPRTFAGIKDDDGDGKYEYLLFFNSYYATQDWAESILTSFGATDVVMLDGGGSSFISYRASSTTSTTPYAPTRTLPHVLAIYSGD